MSKPKFRVGVVAILGQPNVGKSTLLNAWVGEKVSIVSPKAQTTRGLIRGIVHRKSAQIVLVDTPGFNKRVGTLLKMMRRSASQASTEADVGIIVVDALATDVADLDQMLIEMLQKAEKPMVLVLNKIDKLSRKEELLPLLSRWAEVAPWAALIPLSAKTGDGLDQLETEIINLLPVREPLFPNDIATSESERFLCAELVREQLLRHLQQEIPHGAAVQLEVFDDQRREDGKGLVHIEGRILVTRTSQRAIVIGRSGAMIKTLSQDARVAMEELLGSKVYLRLTVAVDANWMQNQELLVEMGLNTKG